VTENRASLVRGIGRWSLAALVLNGIIGSGIFALPGTVGAKLGAASPWAWLAAALVIGVIMACFAEVASRFGASGGTYLYARVAFGRFAGLQMGWMTLLVRITASATNVNVFNAYVTEFWPTAGTTGGKALVAALLVGILAAINYRGVRGGTSVSNTFAALKLLPLITFAALGIWWITTGKSAPLALGTDTSSAGWLQALMWMSFAYGGFEAALLPLAEARDPRRDAPFALFTGLGVVVLLYASVQLAVLTALPDPASSNRPLAAAAGVFLGAGGAGLMACAALLSVYGYLASGMVNVPRLTYAMAEQRDLPQLFGRVHERFRTPHISILFYALATWILAVQGDLIQNLSLSAVSRLLTYGVVCIALIQFRRRENTGRATEDGPAHFRLPFGHVFAALGTVFAIILATQMTTRESLLLSATILIALLHWALVRRPPPPTT
jgi:amino acid transporter